MTVNMNGQPVGQIRMYCWLPPPKKKKEEKKMTKKLQEQERKAEFRN